MRLYRLLSETLLIVDERMAMQLYEARRMTAGHVSPEVTCWSPKQLANLDGKHRQPEHTIFV